MTADLAIAAIPVALALAVGLVVMFADAHRTIRNAPASVAKPDPLPTYEPADPERPFSAGDEADVVQALALAAEGSDPIDAAAMGRIWRRVEDELAVRRIEREGSR